MYNWVTIPLRMAYDQAKNPYWFIPDYLCDTLYWMDIGVNFIISKFISSGSLQITVYRMNLRLFATCTQHFVTRIKSFVGTWFLTSNAALLMID